MCTIGHSTFLSTVVVSILKLFECGDYRILKLFECGGC